MRFLNPSLLAVTTLFTFLCYWSKGTIILVWNLFITCLVML